MLPCQENPNVQNDCTFVAWKLCDRICHALDSYQAFQLRKTFQAQDVCSTGYVSGCQFASILSCALNGCLSDNDICRLADYFKTDDAAGVAYGYFLDVIMGEDEQNSSGRSRQNISSHEHRRLSLLLMEIAKTLRFREQVLRPYFEDCDLIARYGGSVTIGYFKRVLYYLGITLRRSECDLLVKRFMVDNYRVDYESFVEEIDQLFRYLDAQGPIDRQCDAEVPPKVIAIELTKVERPEVENVRLDEILRKNTTYHPCLKPSRAQRDFQALMLRIQRYVWENRIRIREFFEQYDLHCCGWISRSQFIRSMDAIGLSGLFRLPLTDGEIRTICDHYQDTHNNSRIRWACFTDDVDEVFTIKNLDKGSYKDVESPLKEVGNIHLHEKTHITVPELLDDVVRCVRNLVETRRILIRPAFRDFDSHRNGHISRNQMGEALSMAGIFITEEQRYALEQRYSDDFGFNYVEFLQDVDPMPKIASAVRYSSRIPFINLLVFFYSMKTCKTELLL
ncbi:AAEL008428-PA [Aedes aegypti]|uniref:AAEL008428-PA n=1 Tax=Aedes aegypti TaxID=7159 RepID=Q16YT3_AEDAE|nr:AAEL008428-PA [Aedes aegypti]